MLRTKHGVTSNDLITCDSAEQKSVGDYRADGLMARSAEKDRFGCLLDEVVAVFTGDCD